jgi:hypothetical protein
MQAQHTTNTLLNTIAGMAPNEGDDDEWGVGGFLEATLTWSNMVCDGSNSRNQNS